jgi:alkylhydroperoxidase/carboxymuconolactone decarboxylase family protein YurZ
VQKHALREIMEKPAPDVELVTVALASALVPKATVDMHAKESFALVTARERAPAITQQDYARAWVGSAAMTARVVYAPGEMIH